MLSSHAVTGSSPTPLPGLSCATHRGRRRRCIPALRSRRRRCRSQPGGVCPCPPSPMHHAAVGRMACSASPAVRHAPLTPAAGIPRRTQTPSSGLDLDVPPATQGASVKHGPSAIRLFRSRDGQQAATISIQPGPRVHAWPVAEWKGRQNESCRVAFIPHPFLRLACHWSPCGGRHGQEVTPGRQMKPSRSTKLMRSHGTSRPRRRSSATSSGPLLHPASVSRFSRGIGRRSSAAIAPGRGLLSGNHGCRAPVLGRLGRFICAPLRNQRDGAAHHSASTAITASHHPQHGASTGHARRQADVPEHRPWRRVGRGEAAVAVSTVGRVTDSSGGNC